MQAGKRCSGCSAIYPPSHWAAARAKCPACGKGLRDLTEGVIQSLEYEHYDSSADIQFDLEGLLSPAQLREAWLIGGLGLGLMFLAFGARLGFVFWGGLDGFWSVPIWFDAIVVLMLGLALFMTIWAVKRLVVHRRTLHKSG